MNATPVKQHAPARLSPAVLRRRWQQMLHDPMLADIPGKIELTEQGTIELSPLWDDEPVAACARALCRGAVAVELRTASGALTGGISH
jgi:hypothetical protein